MPTSPQFTVASYNVHKCVGIDGVFNATRIISVIEEMNADIVALQEADMRFGLKGGLLDLAHLKDRTGLVPVDLQVKRSSASHGWHGNVVLLRAGVGATANGIHLPGLEPRGAVIVDIDIPECQGLRVVAAHLGLLKNSRKKQVELLSSIVATADNRAVLIMGDLNEWRRGRRSSLQTLQPSFGPFKDFTPSFPSRRPTLPLDRILARPAHLIRAISVHDTPVARIASDHLPLKAEIDLTHLQEPATGLMFAAQ